MHSLISHTPNLAKHEIHIWRTDGANWADIGALETVLAEEERRRASRFLFIEDKRRFILGRGILRHLLGGYLGRPPPDLELATNQYGKPALAGEPALQFNLSHSGDRILHAFAWHRRLGVDVEAIRPLKDLDQMAAYAFTPRERARFFSLPVSQQIPAFFNCWTRKEAFMKAVGMGLSLSPQLFEVAFTAGEPPALQHLDPTVEEGTEWQLVALDVGRGYATALAAEGHDMRYSIHEMMPDGIQT
ncbi:MAG: 4'-phosphopantetheinyl transferase superfamily protein [Chloroflexi bacterium]|nr:4'-phosphopantetheinyl transferase superfamily protein [Chloroflexota bacterium]